MPLKPGKEHLEENFHELRHGPQFARTRKVHGTETARSQMIAIALKEARKHRAKGGKVHVGPIKGDDGGRTDTIPMKVEDSSYVFPADFISHLGENNSAAGLKRAQELFGPGGLHDGPEGRKSGGRTGKGKPVECVTAGGEFVVPPSVIKNIGHGDVDLGHRILDRLVLNVRKEHIDTLKKLPEPAQD